MLPAVLPHAFHKHVACNQQVTLHVLETRQRGGNTIMCRELQEQHGVKYRAQNANAACR